MYSEKKRIICYDKKNEFKYPRGSKLKSEMIRKYSSPYIKPYKNSKGEYGDKWGLYVLDRKHHDAKDDTSELILIADFDNVNLANAALNSLRQAIKDNLGWDASLYKQQHKQHH